MKKYIIIALIGGFTIPAFAQEQKRDSLPDMVQLGYQTEMPQKSNCLAPPEASTAKCSTKHPK